MTSTIPANQPDSRQVQGETDRLPGMIEVNVIRAQDLDQALEDAIAIVTKTATNHSIGVLVTRTGPGSYVVRAHPAVPYGLIRQQNSSR
ncbi:hypothetical protein LJR014_002023 [Arthrobacter sp. LjRoot14]